MVVEGMIAALAVGAGETSRRPDHSRSIQPKVLLRRPDWQHWSKRVVSRKLLHVRCRLAGVEVTQAVSSWRRTGIEDDLSSPANEVLELCGFFFPFHSGLVNPRLFNCQYGSFTVRRRQVRQTLREGPERAIKADTRARPRPSMPMRSGTNCPVELTSYTPSTLFQANVSSTARME